MRVAIIGATGLIGSLLVDRLLAAGQVEVYALVRRSTGRTHPNWHEHVADASEWPAIVTAIAPDAAVSAIGTTMRAAGNQAAFRAVDLDMAVTFAAAARGAGVRHILTVSSVGADPASANFYLRIKGEMEAALEALGFDRLDIFRPGLLVGERGGERRLGERIGILLSPLTNLVLRGKLDRFAAIDARLVADAIATALVQRDGGTHRYENLEIRELAKP